MEHPAVSREPGATRARFVSRAVWRTWPDSARGDNAFEATRGHDLRPARCLAVEAYLAAKGVLKPSRRRASSWVQDGKTTQVCPAARPRRAVLVVLPPFPPFRRILSNLSCGLPRQMVLTFATESFRVRCIRCGRELEHLLDFGPGLTTLIRKPRLDSETIPARAGLQPGYASTNNKPVAAGAAPLKRAILLPCSLP